MKQIFKVGDKVFHYEFGGWGEVIAEYDRKHTQFRIYCSFPKGNATFTGDGRYYETHPPTLSFTEYTLEGFSQERPKELPKPGDIVWVRDSEYDNWMITYFRKYVIDRELKYGTNPRNSGSSQDCYFYRYLTTENPYK
jgi:hypothetical protein